jgi:actin-related protein
MDEFESEMDGEILYQPRKTEKSWKYAIFNAPLVDDKRHFTIITPEMSKGKEKSEEITVNY